jgi:hypothetical protein
MTVERRFVAGLKDIRAIVCECTSRSCGARLVLGTDKATVPEQCPNPRCGEPWQTTGLNGEGGKSPMAALVMAIRHAVAAADDRCGFRVLLEFDEPAR